MLSRLNTCPSESVTQLSLGEGSGQAGRSFDPRTDCALRTIHD